MRRCDFRDELFGREERGGTEIRRRCDRTTEEDVRTAAERIGQRDVVDAVGIEITGCDEQAALHGEQVRAAVARTIGFNDELGLREDLIRCLQPVTAIACSQIPIVFLHLMREL